MNKERYFHFTLGPVQSFVAQARRTRDFWAGSFVLSWLSAVAMREVIAQHGNDRDCIRFPRPDPDFMEWLDGRRVGDGDKTRPVQGSVPNRFTAVVNRDSFDPNKVVQAVDDAWRGLAATVRKADLEGHAGPGARDIWYRQVEGFWERSWAIVTDETDTAVLDRRKNLRNHMPPEEPGVKCMVMDGWQELSGALSPTRPDKDVLDSFWQAMRSQRDETLLRDLRPDEYLCAIAFVKRRFPRHFERVRIKMPSGWTAHGWKVPQTVPSVVYMAAVPWLAEMINTLDAKDLRILPPQENLWVNFGSGRAPSA